MNAGVIEFTFKDAMLSFSTGPMNAAEAAYFSRRAPDLAARATIKTMTPIPPFVRNMKRT
ncbi:hypothetical protein GCM10010994_24010 [Chelatococcus reniformis]|uniref:Uncharacterized protein n=1 Tax=Chelatococcus reniformis TaxID=1494448 RepID=A0A916U8K6_9HYPH|nr:hypothetical protein GCM10010994_24010 [Chelatococcus reniformis]